MLLCTPFNIQTPSLHIPLSSRQSCTEVAHRRDCQNQGCQVCVSVCLCVHVYSMYVCLCMHVGAHMCMCVCVLFYAVFDIVHTVPSLLTLCYSGFLFLRLICPALINPLHFNTHACTHTRAHTHTHTHTHTPTHTPTLCSDDD